MLKKIAAALIAAFLLCGNAGAFSAQTASVYDMVTGRFLYSHGGSQRMLIASTTKIMTALVALEIYAPDELLSVSPEYLVEGSSMYLKAGEQVAVRDLLYGLLLMSGNDAAETLASAADGGRERFIALMNEKATALGLENTSFRNPSGLDEDGHYSTAEDLARLASSAMENDLFREIVSTRSGTFAGRHMSNHNKLLWQLDGAIGVKTGYTISAGRCLVSAIEKDGYKLIIVTLNAPDDWDDHAELFAKTKAEHPLTTLVENGSALAKSAIAAGGYAEVCTHESFSAVLSEEEAERCNYVVYCPQLIYAAPQTGMPAGRLEISFDGKPLHEMPLYWR
jgi:D-alanyl-D-alanine carboxypeptidase